MRLLVSGIGNRHHLMETITEMAAERGFSVLGADSSEWPAARASVAEFHRLPDASDPDFLDAYLALVDESTADATLSLTDAEIPLISSVRVDGCAVLHLEPESALTCGDRLEFHRVLTSAGVPTLPTVGRRPRLTLVGRERHDLVLQPQLTGRRYSVDAYYSLESGRLIDFCALAIDDSTAGESIVLESVDPTRFEVLLRRLGAALPLAGIVTVEFGEHLGQLVVIAVSCRIGENYVVSHELGVDLISLALDEVLGGHLAPCMPEYEVGMRVSKDFAYSEPYLAAVDAS